MLMATDTIRDLSNLMDSVNQMANMDMPTDHPWLATSNTPVQELCMFGIYVRQPDFLTLKGMSHEKDSYCAWKIEQI